MPSPTPPSDSHTPLRLAEKHYKSRALLPFLPTLEYSPAQSTTSTPASTPDTGPSRPTLDLSRPSDAPADPVYTSGWWAPAHADAWCIAEASGEVQGKRGGKRGAERDEGVGGKAWRGLVKDLKAQMERGHDGGCAGVDLGVRGGIGPEYVYSDGAFAGEQEGRWGVKRIKLKDGKVGYVVAEGCIVIPNYLSPADQFALARSALAEYTRAPNPRSLDAHYAVPSDLFARYAAGDHTRAEVIQPLHALRASESAKVDAGMTVPIASTSADSAAGSLTAEGSRPGGGGRRTIETPAEAVVDFEEVLRRNARDKADEGGANGLGAPSDKIGPRTVGELVREMRWANLGLVYREWTTKSYDFAPEVPILFPPDLAQTCTGVVRDVPWDDVFAGVDAPPAGYGAWVEDYEPDTGIVNFYQLSDTLMAHVDRAELDPSRPLVSISLGHSAIFLLGSSSRDDTPTPLILRSGDVLVMAGKGRQAYHGVPRIMEGTLPPYFARPPTTTDGDDPEGQRLDDAVCEFMRTARINVNVRQVFPPGFERNA